MIDKISLTNDQLELLTDMLADKVVLRISHPNEQPDITPSNQEDVLFKSLKEIADYYDCCYQTISNNLGKIKHIKIGNSIKIYRSDFEAAMTREGFLSKKKGGVK
ncbi:MAG: helix-turn-helix domain-containing protein [Bacteroidales bacterium]|nr:helix-turn-helix domain-containing protein [Bacteroidales bacterium]